MDEYVRDYYCQYSDNPTKGNFHTAIALHDSVDVDWETLSQVVPILPKGWFELCQLPKQVRIQFTLDFWLSKLPYFPYLDKSLSQFFGNLDDIGVYLIQKKYDDPFTAEMVYSLTNTRGFYRGQVLALDDDVANLQKLFPNYILPKDFMAFLQIHNGFCKATDCTGVTSSFDMYAKYACFQKFVKSRGQITTRSGRIVNPKTLLPFYESFGMPYFQCFWDEWHPEQEMGNVYYNGTENLLSDPPEKSREESESLAFPTFLDWLIFYLEPVEK